MADEVEVRGSSVGGEVDTDQYEGLRNDALAETGKEAGDSKPEVDESKFEAMQIVAAAAGPEAEARRDEMTKNAELRGRAAEMGAKKNADAEVHAKKVGLTPEETRDRIAVINKDIATIGVKPDVNMPEENGFGAKGIKVGEIGVTETNHYHAGGRLYRNPNEVNPAAKAAREEAAKQPQEVTEAKDRKGIRGLLDKLRGASQ